MSDPSTGTRTTSLRALLIAALVVAAAGVVLALPPIAQDPAYHFFADRRRLFGVPNALNVLSNALFVLVGVLGLVFVWRARGHAGGQTALDGWERAVAWALFTGITLTGFGSAYYHAAPRDDTLVWDRLPLTVVFMALFALVIGDRVGAGVARVLCLPLLGAGVGSVLYWQWSGDLRLYGLVQFFPLVAVPLLLALLPGAHTHAAALVAALGCYAAAKVFEAGDATIYALGGVVSGHTLKHLASAAGTYLILRWLAVRTRR